jgi:hypothetical protein
MEDTKALLEPLLERAEAYGKSSLKLIKLKTVQTTATSLSIIGSRSLALASFVMFGLMTSIGVAVWLGELLERPFIGFALVAGFYGLLGLVFYFLTHNWMKERIGNSIVSQLLK